MELNPYKRAEWTLDEGPLPGRIQALAQTPDGYLWIGTSEGLLRFDGRRFVSILTEQKHPLRQILGLTVDKQGSLWVRAADTRLRRVRGETLSSPLTSGNRILEVVTTAPARSEGIFATDMHKNVHHVIGDRVVTLPLHPKALLISIAEGSDGTLWVGTDRGLLAWRNDKLSTVVGAGVDQKINCLLPEEGGRLWVGTDDGLAYWDGNQLRLQVFSQPDMFHVPVLALLRDREANLWIGTPRGLLRYNSASTEWTRTGKTGDRSPVTALLQDREGDIWFGSGSTLHRLSSTPIIPVELGLPIAGAELGPVYADRHGRIWFTVTGHGLYWMERGVVHPVSPSLLTRDEIYSIDGDGEDLWIGQRRRGLTRLRLRNGSVESRAWSPKNGIDPVSVFAVRAGADGVIWAGTLTDGLYRLEDGHFRHFAEPEGLPANDVSAIELGGAGEVWVGTSNGVCRITANRCIPLAQGDGSAPSDVLSLLNDPSRGLWVGTAAGLLLANASGQHQVSLGNGPQPRVLGLGLDRWGMLWVTSDRSVMSASPDDLISAKGNPIRMYGAADGLDSAEGVRRSRSLVGDAVGHLWLTTAHQLTLIGNKPPQLPTVIPHVEEITADGSLLDQDKADVPAGTKRVSFGFTGLDLRAPTRVQFRYRLDGFDKTWGDISHDQRATYTNLAPGKYTFRLIATNESHTWDAPESSIEVTVEPHVWQRRSVRLFSAVLLLLLLFLTYHARMRFVLGQASLLAEERLRERTRIARDIHDTLLQGFISSLMHLHVAERRIETDSPLKSTFSSVLDGMERVIEEGRLAVVGLRTPDSPDYGLESSLREFFQEIADLGEAHLSIRTSGRARQLNSAASAHISAITKEAVLNAVRHSRAAHIQVLVSWGWRSFRMVVSDDGAGMDASILRHGRAHHWGLVGMRERADQLKSRLEMKSAVEAGTSITLRVPASVAYRPNDGK